jgi:hypothetical protein
MLSQRGFVAWVAKPTGASADVIAIDGMMLCGSSRKKAALICPVASTGRGGYRTVALTPGLLLLPCQPEISQFAVRLHDITMASSKANRQKPLARNLGEKQKKIENRKAKQLHRASIGLGAGPIVIDSRRK